MKYDVRSGRQKKCIVLLSSALLFIALFSFSALGGCAAEPSWKLGKFQTDDVSTSGELNECPVAFSPDGHLAASGGQDNVVRLWDMKTHLLLRTIPASDKAVMAVAFSADSKLLASGSGYPGQVKIWDAQTGKLKQTLKGHPEWIRALAFSPDGKLLATGSSEKTVKLWDVQTGALRRSLTGGHGNSALVRSLAFSPDGKILASGGLIEKNDMDDKGRVYRSETLGSEVRLWDVETGKLKWILPDGAAPVVFSPNGKTLASASRTHEVMLWDVQSGKLRRKLQHGQPLGAIALSRDGATLASSTGFLFDNPLKKKMLIRLWNANDGSLKSTLQSHGSAVISMAFSPDGDSLACADYSSSIEILKFK